MRHRSTVVPALAGAVLAASLWSAGSASADVSLAVMNPRGDVSPPAPSALQPRPQSLDGKRIALLENGKAGAKEFMDALEEQVHERYPSATVLRLPKPEGSRFAFDAKEWYPEVARQADAFAYGMGD